MPLPLSVAAAAIDASRVPWPLGSVVGSPPKADQPGTSFDDRSSTDASTPVSSTAIVARPLGTTTPWTWSQPICASAHCSPYEGSLAPPAIDRLWTTSTCSTDGTDWYAASTACSPRA